MILNRFSLFWYLIIILIIISLYFVGITEAVKSLWRKKEKKVEKKEEKKVEKKEEKKAEKKEEKKVEKKDDKKSHK